MSTSATSFPQFIDTASCLCGLIPSREPDPNGGQVQLWRCISDVSGSLESGSDGKWFNTSLPSQELSGLAQPENSGQNPPDTSQAYVLEDSHGETSYQKLSSSGSSGLTGDDKSCTGKNSTSLSREYYGTHTLDDQDNHDNHDDHDDHDDHDEHDHHSEHDSSSSIAAHSTSSVKSSTLSSVTTSSIPSTTPSTTASSGLAIESSSSSPTSTSSSTSPSPSPSSSQGSSSSAPHMRLKTVAVMGMILAPWLAAML